MSECKCWSCIYEFICDWSENEGGKCEMYREVKDDANKIQIR